MALDPRRRQKKIERKKAKDKDRKQDAVRREKLEAAREKALIAISPIYACRVQNCLETEGIAQAILVRELPDHRLATAVILIDAYCLGIKDSFYKILSHGEYRELVDGLENSGSTRAIEPAAMKRLIDGAIAYARQLGFEPHRDYAKAEFLLQAIDTSTCQEEFEYGRDGKPCYIRGPHDSVDRQRSILGMLRGTQGDGKFDYVLMQGLPGYRDLSHNFAQAEEDEVWEDEDLDGEDDFAVDELLDDNIIDVPFKTPEIK